MRAYSSTRPRGSYHPNAELAELYGLELARRLLPIVENLMATRLSAEKEARQLPDSD